VLRGYPSLTVFIGRRACQDDRAILLHVLRILGIRGAHRRSGTPPNPPHHQSTLQATVISCRSDHFLVKQSNTCTTPLQQLLNPYTTVIHPKISIAPGTRSERSQQRWMTRFTTSAITPVRLARSRRYHPWQANPSQSRRTSRYSELDRLI